jgi:hypothetical protein
VPSVRASGFARLISTWCATSGNPQAAWMVVTSEGRKLLTPKKRTLPALCNWANACATCFGSAK